MLAKIFTFYFFRFNISIYTIIVKITLLKQYFFQMKKYASYRLKIIIFSYSLDFFV